MNQEIIKKIGKTFFVWNTILFIVSFSFSFVILFRPFYYYHIKSLNLVDETNHTYQEIKDAYDDIIDYTVFHKSFRSGVFICSLDAKNHFKDCQLLFTFLFVLLTISFMLILIRKKYFSNLKIFNHSIPFWSSCFLIFIIVIFLLLTFMIGFENIFTFFHKIFFIGKDNWLFDPDIDPIIYILPEQYFMNCAIFVLIIISIFLLCIFLFEFLFRKKRIIYKDVI